MQYVAFYSVTAHGESRTAEVYPRHRAYLDEFGRHGGVVGVGTFSPRHVPGAMAIFSSRDAAARFLAADPFVLEGVVTPSEILEWNPVTFPE